MMSTCSGVQFGKHTQNQLTVVFPREVWVVTVRPLTDDTLSHQKTIGSDLNWE